MLAFTVLGLVDLIWVFFFLSVWHSCASQHAMTLSWILSSCAHRNIPRLGWGTLAVPMVPSGASQAMGVFSELQTWFALIIIFLALIQASYANRTGDASPEAPQHKEPWWSCQCNFTPKAWSREDRPPRRWWDLPWQVSLQHWKSYPSGANLQGLRVQDQGGSFSF